MIGKQQCVYWEQQGIDQLCGLHTLNSLMQGPYFNEIQMAEIALQLDRQEQQIMGPTSKASENVGDDGNYSIQVLQECLKLHKLTSESVDSKINRNDDLSNETGFICNSRHHWFAIRKVNGIWYNMNSCSVYGPQTIGGFYMSAFLQSVKQGGYTVFVIKGNLPGPNMNTWGNLQKYQRFLPVDVQQKYENYAKNQGSDSMNIGAYDASNMEKAIEESKTLADLVRNQEMPDLTKIEQEENKINKFSGQGVTLSGNDTIIDYVNFYNIGAGQDDPELAFAMVQSLKMSLGEKFTTRLNDGITLRFIHPTGEKVAWTFNENSLVEEMYDYAFYTIPEKESPYKFYLAQTHPNKKFTNLKQTLVQADIEDMTNIYITKI